MSLESGVYNIRCKGTGTCIGRHHVEDLSSLPKQICSLSNSPGQKTPAIVIKKLDSGVYAIKERSGIFAEKNGRLFAFLAEPEDANWLITAQINHQNDKLYTVTKVGEEGVGWVIGEPPRGNEINQVQVMTLATTRSLPPQYLANELFEFIRID